MMKESRPMFLFYFSFGLAVLASMLYHIIAKVLPSNVNPAISLFVSYSTAALLSLTLLFFFPLETSMVNAFRDLRWTTVALALAVVGIDVGFILAYRSGWNVSLATLLVNVGATVLLIPIGLLLFKEKLSSLNVIGIILCIAGLILANIRT